MQSKWYCEAEYLRRAIIDEKKSYDEIGKEYNCSGSNIRKIAVRLGIELPQRRKINPKETFHRKKYICENCGKEFEKRDGCSNKFCCNDCRSEKKHSVAYKNFLEHPEKYARANYSAHNFKDDILKEQDCKCAICGMGPFWNGRKLVFVLDHIDGHASHNFRENLRLICPNCDSQLDTYKRKNKCGERSYYRYHRKNNTQKGDTNTDNPHQEVYDNLPNHENNKRSLN